MEHRGAVLLAPTPRRPISGLTSDGASGPPVHPDWLVIGRRRLRLVDDPVTRPIQDGHPTLGWDGDARMALYIDTLAGEWVLVRLEFDEVYRITTSTSFMAQHLSATDVVGQLIVWLIDHDGRRGFDPYAAMVAANTARDNALDAAFDDEMAGDILPRLRHAFRRDAGAHF